jgi:superfamily II DNA/RNA helicase
MSSPTTASRPDAASAPAIAGAPSFASLGLAAPLVAALGAAGITTPFPIQVATLPDALAGRDVLGQGRTGSGKTLAFALPVVARLLATPRRRQRRRPRALVLVPTRELAMQVAAVIEPLAATAGARVATIFGGVPAGAQLRALDNGVEIVVACPGRLLDHMGTGAADLSTVEVTVIDEADHMADQGFLPMVQRILDATPARTQRLLFSATLAGGVDALVRRYLHDPVEHAVAVEAPAEMDHHVLVVDDADRIATVAAFARRERVVVFTRTKHRARQLAQRLGSAGVGAVDLHGNLSQAARTRNLAAFADGSASALVATDIAARGIHVDEVPLVLHADPPVEHKAYVHRAGRTARAGAAGRVVTIATHAQRDEVRDLLRRAGVTARWSNLPTGRAADAIATVDAAAAEPLPAAPAAARPAAARPAAAGTRGPRPSAPAGSGPGAGRAGGRGTGGGTGRAGRGSGRAGRPRR